MANPGPTKRSPVIFWVGGFLFLFGSAFAFSGFHSIVSERDYLSLGKTVQGQVLSKWVDENWDNDRKTGNRTKRTNYKIKYSFAPPGAPAIESSTFVSSDTYQAANEGQPIEIQYLSTNPGKNRVAEPTDYTFGLTFLGIGGLVLLIGGGMIWYEVKTRITTGRLMRDGETAEAVVQQVAPGNLSINDVEQWRISYSFSDRMGHTHSAVTPHMAPKKAKEWKVGDKGTIRFDPANPKINIWIGR